MIVIATHAVFLDGKDIYGPPHAVSLYLNKKKIEHLFIKHPLTTSQPSWVEHYKKGKIHQKITQDCTHSFAPIRYAKEYICNLKYVWQFRSRLKLFIGVDPLNMLAGLTSKLLLSSKSVYFSADFAFDRFPSFLLNNLYHFLDKLATKNADEVWSVSRRICEYRSKFIESKKNKILPNAPFYKAVKRVQYSSTNPHDIVLVSALEKGIAFTNLFRAVSKVRKTQPKIRLFCVGAGSLEKKLKTYTKRNNLEKTIKFLGALSHEDMFKVLVKSGIGVALYDTANKRHFRYFSDPMKVRDYMASGLPVIISGNSAINQELIDHNCGFVVQPKTKDIEEALLKMMGDSSLHKKMRKTALKLAREYDTYSLLEKYIPPLL